MATRTSRATVMSGKDFEIREYPIVDPAPGTVLVRQELGGICGTDLHNWEFQRIDHDIILGHENVGVIETLGEGVEMDYLGNPVKEGDRIALSPSGGLGFSPSEEAPYLRGGFSEYIYLSNPATNMFIKTDLPPEIAVLAEPASCAAHCVSRGKIEFGDTVVIQGTGPIGLLALNWARVSGLVGLLLSVDLQEGLRWQKGWAQILQLTSLKCRTRKSESGLSEKTHRKAMARMLSTNVRVSSPLFPKV